MPQLDFTWWIVNFLLVWTCVLVVLVLLLNTPSSTNTGQASTTTINKPSTIWQW